MKEKTDFADKDNIRQIKSQRRERAIKNCKSWAKTTADLYEEPTRAGTAKGDPIGLSRKKYYAALLMVLRPNSLNLKEIAKTAGVSDGVLRVWRTEQRFKKAVKEARHDFGTLIVSVCEAAAHDDSINTTGEGLQGKFMSEPKIFDRTQTSFSKELIEGVGLDRLSDFSSTLLEDLPFYNIEVSRPFTETIIRKLKDGDFAWYWFFYKAERESAFYDGTIREWEADREIIETDKNLIGVMIDGMIDPKLWKNEEGQKQLQEFAALVKDFIAYKLDVLAG